jgi:gliding motility-associated protein GldM
MAGAKETPRQKLIGMMYLVLTALLALQVSSEIINKFDLMNRSLEKSANEATDANQKRIDAIQAAVKTNGNLPNDVQALQQAQQVKAKSAEMIAYLDGIKKEMIEKSGGIKQETGGYTNPSAETVMEELMIGATKNGKAYEVREKLNAFTSYLGSITKQEMPSLALDAKDIANLKNDPAQKNKDFAELNFAQTPMVASLAVISQKQNEVARYETAVLENLAAKVGATQMRFDKIVAMVRPEAKVLAAGTKYKAEMFIAASSSGVTPTMTYNGSSIPVNGGMGKIEFTAQGGAYDKEGKLKKTWKGSITVRTPSGKDTTFTHTEEYTVVKPVIQVQSAAVQALYANCGNELNIAVPALGAEYRPSFSGSGAQFIQGSRTGDVMIVPTGTEVSLSVSSGGNLIGTEKFKVRPVPRPSVKPFAGGRELNIKLGLDAPYPTSIDMRALAEEGFAALLPKDARFKVAETEVFLVRGKRPVGGAVRGDDRLNIGSLMSQARPGDRLYIEVKNVKRMNFKGQLIDSQVSGSPSFSIQLN